MSGATRYSALASLFKYLWPFVKDTFFKGQDVKEIVLQNKLVIVLLIALAFSFLLHYASFSKIYEYAIFHRKPPAPTEQTNKVQVSPPVEKPPVKSKPKSNDSIIHDLEKIYDS